MFKNFFKKQSLSQAATLDVIEKIHNEFDIAGDNLLREAKEILQSEHDTAKGERLSKLGFIICKPERHKVLMETIEQIPKSTGFPFTTTIIEENERYEFT